MTRLVMVDGSAVDVDVPAHTVIAQLIAARRAGSLLLALTGDQTLPVADIARVVPEYLVDRLGTECEA